MKTFTLLKSTLVSIGLCATGGAAAFGPGDRIAATGYGFEPSLERAWVEVTYTNDLTVELPPKVQKVALDGLRYDAQRRAVVQQVGTQDVVCATESERGIGLFRNTWMAPTGDCAIDVRSAVAEVDNGFLLRQVPQLSVELNVNGSQQLAAGRATFPVN